MVATSATGKRHLQLKQACQDSVRWELGANGWLVAALADGAGSARLGEVGSAKATEAGLASLRSFLRGPGGCKDAPTVAAALREALRAAQEAVIAEAPILRAVPGDLATTLALCVAGPEFLGAVQVGDGAVVFGDDSGQWHTLTKPAAGEYLNETVFLTSEGALGRAQCELRPGQARRVALFSDGLQMLALKMPEAAPHPPFFKPLFEWLGRAGDVEAAGADLKAWLGSPRVVERTDDDLTLLLATRLE